MGQPEIIEKSRICEAFGAEVVQMTVGPELFSHMLELLEETGYLSASLYSPFGVSGIESLGAELAEEMIALTGAPPTHVVCTHAGGGNTTGTARGLKRVGAKTEIISASVDLSGLHMASDTDFNRKSFTTGHTGFGVPFATWPDRADVPRNAARSLRYMDRYLTVTQGEVFYVTEALTKLGAPIEAVELATLDGRKVPIASRKAWFVSGSFSHSGGATGDAASDAPEAPRARTPSACPAPPRDWAGAGSTASRGSRCAT